MRRNTYELKHWNKWHEWKTRLLIAWFALTRDSFWLEGEEDE